MLEWLLAASLLAACDTLTIVAHRGGTDAGFPENTLAAFRAAATAGAHAVELDVRTSRDGAFVVLHDARIDRTTDGRGRVARLSAEQVAELIVADEHSVPLLKRVLVDTAGLEMALVLDLKDRRLDLQALVDEVRRSGRLDDVVFGVRSVADVSELKSVHPDLTLLAFPKRPTQVEAYLAAGVDVVRLWPNWLERHPDLPDRVRTAGRAVWLTTGDAPPERLLEWASLGIVGFITDRPRDALAAFGCAGARPGGPRSDEPAGRAVHSSSTSSAVQSPMRRASMLVLDSKA